MVDLRTDTTWHADILEALARRMKPAVYLELGVASGETFARVEKHCGRAIGVDRSGAEYTMLTDEYFAGPGLDLAGIELAFIDADHRSAQAYRDFGNVYDRTVRDGLICLHDTFPENEEQKADGFCSDSWRVPGIIHGNGALSCEMVTLPFPPGLTIVRKLC